MLGKTTRFNCCYLTVELTDVGLYRLRGRTPEGWRAAAKELRDQIERHCDSGRIDIETDSDDLCEFCGALWTEGDDPHNGGCCAEDIKVLEALDDKTEAA